jgi:Ca2+-binding RTX toxin-like protein
MQQLIQNLEPRRLLSGHGHGSVHGQTLRINGTTGNDAISIVLDAANKQAVVTNNGVVANVALSTFKKIEISGLAGDDTISSDIAVSTKVRGGDGNDKITTGAGKDEVDGGIGNDTISSGAGRDELKGGDGNDSLSGGADGDHLSGGKGADELYGEAGNDKLSGGADNDKLVGGDGNDALFGDQGADTLDGGAGSDLLRGGADTDSITGGADADKFSQAEITAGEVTDYVAGTDLTPLP